jgi:hypothetical protein
MIVNIVNAIAPTHQLAVAYHAYIVEYQCASNDMTHCQITAALEKAAIGKNGPAYFFIFL